ncbi:MAG: glycoside hydrolase family 5 protein [Myxococcota bacterium]
MSLPCANKLVLGLLFALVGCADWEHSDEAGQGGAPTAQGGGGGLSNIGGMGGSTSQNGGSSCTLPPGVASVVPRGLHAVGNELQDANGEVVRLRGVNRSGTEYACTSNSGFFDGPSDDVSIRALLSWNVNAVRVPLNESCWLSISGAPARFSGDAYKTAIKDFVQRLENAGLIPILELHRAAPADVAATKLFPMPNADHTPEFWRDVATTFLDDDAVVFEPYNEPYPDRNRDTEAAWACWRDGCTMPASTSGGYPEYQAVGMQELVSAIRSVGSTHLILLGGVQYSNALSRWLSYAPQDPLNNIGAAWHVYNFNACANATCWNNNAAVVAAQVPLVATEIGQDDCAATMVTPLMQFLDAQKAGYLAWWWNVSSMPCTPNGPMNRGDGPPFSLITDYSCPIPKSPFAQAIYDHFTQVTP